jgi:hypothetical protein
MSELTFSKIDTMSAHHLLIVKMQLIWFLLGMSDHCVKCSNLIFVF